LAPTSIDPGEVRVEILESSARSITARYSGSNFRADGTALLRAPGRADIPATTSRFVDSETYEFTFTLPDSSHTEAGGFYNLIYTNTTDGSDLTVTNSVLLEIPGIFFYPNRVSVSAMRAASPPESARIAYTLSEDKPIRIFIYDVRQMRVIYHRTYASGAPGGRAGYNETPWDLVTDQGRPPGNGSYILQVYSDDLIGQTYFVVID